MAELSPCAAEVRRHDRDRFVCALFVPGDRREAVFALLAFSLEIARIRESVREPLAGQIRLQWWRDAIADVFADRPARHYVTRPLAEAVRRFGLGRIQFDRLIDARALDLADEPPADLAALESYAEATSASLTTLVLETLGERGDAALRAARHVGIAWALVGIVRSVPFRAAGRRLYLPASLMRESGLTAGAVFQGRTSPALCAVVGMIAERAAAHLDQARALRPLVPRAAIPALLPATLAKEYLARLHRAGFDPFDAGVQASPVRRLLPLACNALRGRY